MPILQTYERLLREATIHEALAGRLNVQRAHDANEETLMRIWHGTMLKIFASDTSECGERFARMNESDQRAYFRPDSTFSFERFQSSFLERFRKHHGIVLN